MVNCQRDSLQQEKGSQESRRPRARERAVRGGLRKGTALKRNPIRPCARVPAAIGATRMQGSRARKVLQQTPPKHFLTLCGRPSHLSPWISPGYFPSVLPRSSANGRRQRPGDFSQILNKSAGTLMPWTSGLAIILVRMCNVSNVALNPTADENAPRHPWASVRVIFHSE